MIEQNNQKPAYSGPAYKIITPRLVLRCLQPTDAQLLLDAISASRDYLLPWMHWAVNEPTSLQAKIDMIRVWQGNFNLGKDYAYGIFSRDESRVLGGTGLHIRRPSEWIREIGYWIHKDFAGQGLATETVAALTKTGFEVDRLQRIEIHCDPANIASEKVILKSGYIYEGTLRGLVQKPDGSYRDQKVFGLLASEYPNSPNAKIAIEAYDAYGRRLI